MAIRGPHDVLVDLALVAPPNHDSTLSVAGPTFAIGELAGRKIIALFDRAEARDFADVYALARHYDRDTLLTQAAAIDAGFDTTIFADMLRSLNRFADADIPIDTTRTHELRAFFSNWAEILRSHP